MINSITPKKEVIKFKYELNNRFRTNIKINTKVKIANNFKEVSISFFE